MTDWTEEMLAIAVGMKRAGLPTAAIAKRLGVTPAASWRCGPASQPLLI